MDGGEISPTTHPLFLENYPFEDNYINLKRQMTKVQTIAQRKTNDLSFWNASQMLKGVVSREGQE